MRYAAARGDCDDARRRVAVGVVPAGSGNGLAKSLTHAAATPSPLDPPLRIGARIMRGAPAAEEWACVEGEFLFVWACNLPWMTMDSCPAPEARAGDGWWRVV
eukprot:gene8433-13231_t